MKFPTAGELIRQYRKQLGVNQSQLCMEKVNINTICKIENGKMQINPILALIISDNINKLAKAQGVDISITSADLLMSDEKKCEIWCIDELKKINAYLNTAANIDKYKEILAAASEYDLHDIVLDVQERLGRCYYELKNFEEAISYFSFCLDRYREIGNLYKVIELTNNIGKCWYITDSTKAYEHYHKAYHLIKTRDSSGDARDDGRYSELKSKVIYNLALYHTEMKAYKAAKSYIDDLEDWEIINEDLHIKIMILKGNIEIGSKDYKTAYETFESLLGIKNQSITPHKHIIYNNLAICLDHLGQTQKSIEYFDLAVKQQLKNNSPNLTHSLINAACIHLSNLKPDIALRYISGAMHNTQLHKQQEYSVQCFHIMYRIYKAKGLWDKCGETLQECEAFILSNNLGNEFIYKNQLMFIDFFVTKDEYENARLLLDKVVNEKEVKL